MTPIFTAICYTIAAGVMNGSFAFPKKYTKQWQFEHVWLNYAIWAFLLLPWAIAFALNSNIWATYYASPTHTLVILMIGGILFGMGQVCFALALNLIGLGLGFVINIGLGTGLGLLLPLIFVHADKILSTFGLVTLIGLVLIIFGLLLSYRAGKLRDTHQTKVAVSAKNQYLSGVILAMMAGVFSAGQNFTFALTHHMQQIALNLGTSSLGASTIIWPLFLSFAFIPYAIYMIYLHKKHNSCNAYQPLYLPGNILLALIMGVFWYGSLILYSQASLLIGELGPIIGWPLFMVLIILTSNFWGWKHKEWEGAPKNAKRDALWSISILTIAVLTLAYGATLPNYTLRN